jgi:hypothetical protein
MSTIAKSYNCPLCGSMYWALLQAELDAFEKMPKAEQVKFEISIRKQHDEKCLNRRKN